MADSLPFGISMVLNQHVPDDDVPVPDDLPVLPPEVLLIIAREYRLATAEDRAFSGWHRVHSEMRYLPRCPKRKRLINLKGFYVPRHGNQLEPVSGYFYRRLIRKVFARDADPRLFQWFRKNLATTIISGATRQPSGPLSTVAIAGSPTNVATRRRMRSGSTRKTSGPFEKRCGVWRMSGPSGTG